MAFFVFPQKWITPAITAAALAFGSVEGADDIHIKYHAFPGKSLGGTSAPDTIIIDKRPKREWSKERAQCTIVHMYGHLAGRKHSKNRNSIMFKWQYPKPCHRWLVRHSVN